jgi:integrase
MKGRIYTSQKCFHCQSPLTYIEGRGFLQCETHHEIKWTGSCIVRFGRTHTKRFQTVIEAERHLTYLRVQTDNGNFDQREWAKNQPLSFLSLRENFLEAKTRSGITPKQIRHIKHVLDLAGKSWDTMQIKDIAEGEIDDFFSADHGISNKTLSNWKTVIHDFFVWVVRREKRRSQLEMPEFPEIHFNMEMKTIVSIDDQQAIIEEVKRISWQHNPRIWLGIKLLSIYPRVRPGELLNVKEGHINLTENWIVFPHPKEKEPKFIHLLPEHAALIKEIRNVAPAMPNVFFFRHLKSRSGVNVGGKFGPKYLNVWWKKACKNLGIESVAVYAGTKHSTVTALGKIMSPEQIKHNVTGHTSNAFQRYFLPDHNEKISATRMVAEMQGDQHLNNIKTATNKAK